MSRGTIPSSKEENEGEKNYINTKYIKYNILNFNFRYVYIYIKRNKRKEIQITNNKKTNKKYKNKKQNKIID